MQNYEQQTPDTSAFLDSENNVQDIQAVLESGNILVSAISSATPVDPIGEATTPKFANIPPWAGKFLNPDNEIIDLLEFLTSGQIKVQVDGGVAPPSATYITSTDETAILPNSFQLLGTANQIDVNNGVLSIPNPFSIPGAAIVNGDLQLAGAGVLFSTDNLILAGHSGAQVIVVNENGFRINGTGATVNVISNDSASDADNQLMTSEAIQDSIDNKIDSALLLAPSGVTYVAENGNDLTGRINSPAFPFYTLQAGIDAVDAISAKIGNVLLVYPRGDATLYENISLTGFSGWEIRGVGNNVIASDLLISDDAVGAAVNGGKIANIYFNNLSISNFNDNIDGTVFEIGAFNDYVLENEGSATNGINSGNKFIDVEFVGSTIYFPGGYEKQINVITETYIGCKFSGTITINGTTTNLVFIACRNIPTIIYANGATNAQVTIYNVPDPSVAGSIMISDGERWTVIAPGSEGQIFKIVSGIPAWVTP